MRFPRPMTGYKCENEYNIIIDPSSCLLDHFQMEDRLFAAQWIWWLASIIQYTEVLIYYRVYTTFPSEYVRDCVVKQLPQQATEETIISDIDIPALDIDDDSDQTKLNSDIYSDIEVHSSRSKVIP